MGVMSICFALRLATFMVRPLGGCLPISAFWALGYIVPEILPALIEMFVVISSVKNRETRKSLRAVLYFCSLFLCRLTARFALEL
jgi:hypothetical protein